MEKLISEIKASTGTNEKLAILCKYSSDTEIREAFRLCYDPFEIFNVNKIKTSVTGCDTFHEKWHEFYDLQEKLKSRKLTGNAAKDAIDDLMMECTKETQEIFTCILQKGFKIGISSTSLKKVYGKDFIKEYKVQLANKWEEGRDYGVKYWFASKKYDGLRCTLFNTKHPHNLDINYDLKTGVAYTRGATEITGFDHVIAELNEICKDNDFEFIDGELYSPDIPFETIQGYVLSYRNVNDDHKKKIKFNVFAVGSSNFKNTNDMVMVLKRVNWKKYEYVIPINYSVIPNTKEEIEKICVKFVEAGFEGAMLRSPDNYYSWDRDNNLLKVKMFKEEDLQITGFALGNGKNSNTLGNIFVEGEIEGKFVRSSCGSGFSDQDRDMIWNNRDKYIGKIVEIKYQNVTTSENTTVYSLRFPVFVKFKEDGR